MPWTIVISDLNGEKIVRTFYEKEQQKTIQKEFRVERVMKRKDDKLYVKWQGYNNFLNSWIDKKKTYYEEIISKTKNFMSKCES